MYRSTRSSLAVTDGGGRNSHLPTGAPPVAPAWTGATGSTRTPAVASASHPASVWARPGVGVGVQNFITVPGLRLMVPAASKQKVAWNAPVAPGTVGLLTFPPRSSKAELPPGQVPVRRGLGSKRTVDCPPAAQVIDAGVKNGPATVPVPPVAPVQPVRVRVPPVSSTPLMAEQVTSLAFFGLEAPDVPWMDTTITTTAAVEATSAPIPVLIRIRIPSIDPTVVNHRCRPDRRAWVTVRRDGVTGAGEMAGMRGWCALATGHPRSAR